jgi:hypothetical protein
LKAILYQVYWPKVIYFLKTTFLCYKNKLIYSKYNPFAIKIIINEKKRLK